MAPLATAQNLADFLGVDVSTIPTGPANLVLAAASGAVRAYCGWQINQVLQDQLVLSGSGMDVLKLPTGHVTQVWSVTLDYTPLSEVVWDGTVPGQYGYTWSSSGYLRRAPMWFWPEGERRITVVLDHGYAVIPDEVVGVVCSVAARVLDNPESLKVRRVGEVQEAYDGAALTAGQLSVGDKENLRQYKITLGRY